MQENTNTKDLTGLENHIDFFMAMAELDSEEAEIYKKDRNKEKEAKYRASAEAYRYAAIILRDGIPNGLLDARRKMLELLKESIPENSVEGFAEFVGGNENDKKTA